MERQFFGVEHGVVSGGVDSLTRMSRNDRECLEADIVMKQMVLTNASGSDASVSISAFSKNLGLLEFENTWWKRQKIPCKTFV